MISRNRSSIPGVRPLMRSASNPGNVGHVWVKKRFIDPAKIASKWWNEEEKKEMGFISSRLEDNPSLSVNDPGYEDRLRVLGDKKFRSLRYGDWEIFEGQFFDEWDNRSGMSVLEYDRVPDTYSRKFLSMDWGYSSPSCILWWEVTPMGRVFIYREFYPTRLSPKELAQAIYDLSPESEKFEALWSPPELWGKEVELEGGGSPIQVLMQSVFDAHPRKITMTKANNARIPGWQKCREYLKKAPDGLPWLQVSPSCKNFIRTVPAQVHDEKKVEDLDTTGEDHACLIGCTKVLTKEGEKDIKSLVGTTGEIWTQQGWKRYFNCHQTMTNTVVVKIQMKNGLSVIATPDHLVLTNQGWKEIRDLTSSDLIQVTSWTRQLFLQRFKNLMGYGITYVGRILEGVQKRVKEIGCTVLFGNLIKEASQKIFMSTIKTVEEATIGWRIWNWSMAGSMSDITCLQKNEKKCRENRQNVFVHLQKNGIVQKQEESGIDNTVKMVGKKLNQKIRLSWFVKCVKKSTQRIGLLIQDFATLIAKCVGIDETTPKSGLISWHTLKENGKADVFDLEVEDVHSFAVNGGIIVHNSDAFRYGAVSLKTIPKTILSPQGVISLDRVYLGKNENEQPMTHIQIPGRSGYGI